MIRALNDTNPWVRIEAASALNAAKLSGPELIPALQAALTNTEPVIRNAARATIREVEAAVAVPHAAHPPGRERP